MRPRDAATLILLRDGREILLGRRHAGHIFMPDCFVFPGGRVEPADSRVRCVEQLSHHSQSLLCRAATPARARALGMAAIRETFEETGLRLASAERSPSRTRSAAWAEFLAGGFQPALSRLDYVARAVTPPGPPRRFDARFFLADARFASGELAGDGELEGLGWFTLEQALDLPLAEVTRLILTLLGDRLSGDRSAPRRPDSVPLYRQHNGRDVLEYH